MTRDTLAICTPALLLQEVRAIEDLVVVAGCPAKEFSKSSSKRLKTFITNAEELVATRPDNKKRQETCGTTSMDIHRPSSRKP